jgi:hypothetical protein
MTQFQFSYFDENQPSNSTFGRMRKFTEVIIGENLNSHNNLTITIDKTSLTAKSYRDSRLTALKITPPEINQPCTIMSVRSSNY